MTQATQRLFAGIALGAELRAALANRIARVVAPAAADAGLRWLAPESWHVTLQFLGVVPEAAIGGVRDACASAAASTRSFELEFDGFGAFASVDHANLLWFGVRAGGDALAGLAAAVCAETARIGFARAERAFHPHVTLARLKPARNVSALLATLEPLALPMRVDALTLFRSRLGQHGASYAPLGYWPLA